MSEPPPDTTTNDDVGLVERMADAYLLGRLVPEFVHATGNDLQIIFGAAELLDLELVPPTVLDRRVAMIVEAATDAIGRTRDLRALALRGRSVRNATLGEAIAASCVRIAHLAPPDRTIPFGIDPQLAERPPPTPSEQRSIERLLVCLVLLARPTVAAEATAPLRVGTRRRAGFLRLVLDAVCPPAEPVTATVDDAVPLDLAVLSALVDRAGGELVRAADPGGGTAITVSLPLRSLESP